MRSFTVGNVKMAFQSLKSSKWRSLLTVSGIVIGIVSVVTIISLGEGVKRQLAAQVNYSGRDLVVVRSGRMTDSGGNTRLTGMSLTANIGSTLTDNDFTAIQATAEAETVLPLSLMPGVATVPEREYADGVLVATTADAPMVLNLKPAFGVFFSAGEEKRHVAVIGKQVAEQLFQENVPVGRSFRLRGQDFIVRGVLEELPQSVVSTQPDYNTAIIIPYGISKELMSGNSHIQEIIIKPREGAAQADVITAVRSAVLASHAGQEDFTVLTQQESLRLANGVLDLITRLVAGIAAISLFVAGIGIMNIMLVSVTERTHEIGVRKAIGASNRQILNQFLLEGMVLTLFGGAVGTAGAFLLNYVLRVFTNLQPVITWQTMALSLGISMGVGIVFGITPAWKAARKDPIQALRYQ